MKEGSKDRYFQHDTSADKLVPEGIEGRVPYKDHWPASFTSYWEGCVLRWAIWVAIILIGSAQNLHFARITNAGVRESHAHDVQITKEAPNYKLS